MANNSTLRNGLRLMALINDEQGSLGVQEMARKLDLAPSQVHRLLQTLVDEGFCVRDADTRRYAAGMRTLALAYTYIHGNALRRIVIPALHTLSSQTGLDSCCALPDGDSLVVVATAWPNGRQSSRSASLGLRLQSDTAIYQCAACFRAVPEHRTVEHIDDYKRIKSQGLAHKWVRGGEAISVWAVPLHNEAGTFVAALALICDHGYRGDVAAMDRIVLSWAQNLVIPVGL